ncbi:MAG TPA: 50S ribosomal protein L22 [Candidatus Nanoarchaeia archaeon]|nr:50S ribosomal protein L22 [Candidatus Nanoarchaeia archaeon]
MKYNYAFKSDKENVVKVVGRDLGISTKIAIEMCAFIRGMPLAKAKATLERVIDKEAAVPFKRFTEGAGHKKGISAGKHPLKASQEFLKLFKALEANAQNKGLSSSLRIIHACAQQAARPLHYGRKRRIRMKRTHLELAVQEMEPAKKEAKEIKQSRVDKSKATKPKATTPNKGMEEK